MKKWMYLLFPGTMLGIFLVFFFSHKTASDAREKARIEVAEKKKADEAKQKAQAEEKAKAAAAQRQIDREKEEADKERTRREKQMAADKQIKDETDNFLNEAKKSQNEVNALELELDRLHKLKDKTSREAFDLAKQVEQSRVNKRNAELENQRFVEMISRKAVSSAMAQMPPPPPPAPAK